MILVKILLLWHLRVVVNISKENVSCEAKGKTLATFSVAGHVERYSLKRSAAFYKACFLANHQRMILVSNGMLGLREDGTKFTVFALHLASSLFQSAR
jgi:hypothetical protein